jgi:hypothetical protein
VEIAAAVVDRAVAAVAEAVAAVVDRAVVDAVVMVGPDTRKIDHGFLYDRKAATKVAAFLSAFEFKRLNRWH